MVGISGNNIYMISNRVGGITALWKTAAIAAASGISTALNKIIAKDQLVD
jgi:hypothetical protein